MLVDDDFVLTESTAIVTYLGDRYGPDSGLIPTSNSQLRARYNEWASFIQMELDAHTLYVMRKHRDLANLYGEAPAAIDASITGFNKQVNVATEILENQPYLLGEHFSAADLLLTTCLNWARSYDFELAPTLASYCQTITARPAFRQAAKLNFSISAGA